MPRPRPARPARAHPAALTLALVAAVAAADACSGDARAAAPDPAAAPAIPVRVAPAARDTGPQTIRVGGVVEPRATADLAFQVGGRVAAVAVDEGTRVVRGQLLAGLDPTDYRLAYAQADLARARAADELGRARLLRASGSIAANDFDRLENGARQAAVARDLAAKRLADTRLVAPFSGVIARKSVEVGATAGAGAAVLTLADLGEVEVRVGVSEADVGGLRAGQPADVEVPALGRTVAGRVARVGAVADPASRTFRVDVAVPNGIGALRGGMVATVRLATGRARDAVTVPAAAVARDPDGATVVYVYAAGEGRVRARRVEVGDARGDAVEVARGLAAGEPVVVAGRQQLRDGSAVSAAPAPDGGR